MYVELISKVVYDNSISLLSTHWCAIHLPFSMPDLEKQWISILEYEMLINFDTWVVVPDYVGFIQLSVGAFGVFGFPGIREPGGGQLLGLCLCVFMCLEICIQRSH
jgi:hypothetical protein